MPRRGENIRKRRDGRWEARYIKEYREDGTAHYGYLYAKTYAEVKARKQAALAAPAKTEAMGGRLVFDTAISEWLARQKYAVKQSTYSRYRWIVDSHIRPGLGGVRMRQISRTLLDGFADQKLTQGRLDGKGGLAPKTVRDLLSVLRQILSYAAERGYLSGGDNLKLKSPKKNNREIEVLTPAEQVRLEGYLTSVFDSYRLGVFLCLYTGLRIGELCALRWCDIHLDTGVLCVRHTIQRIDNPDPDAKSKTIVIIDTPKTESSLREIPLSSFLLAQLQQYSMYALPGAYLLTGESRYIEPRSFYNKYKKYLTACRIGDYTFHALRHTFATRSIEKGFDPKSLSEVLGHADVSITLKLYVHPSMDLKRSYMERLTAAHSWSEIGVPERCPSA